MKKPLKIPKFNDENQEREFWAKIDLSQYFDKSDFTQVKPLKLKKTSDKMISLRLPEYLFAGLKQKARELNMPYQSLIKSCLKKSLFG
jgi:predicted DNA binding CopG/RHH family protein